MMRFRMTGALALCTLMGLGGAALAQSTGAPAGREPATAAGGTEGIAGPRNEIQAIEDGKAVPAPPGVGEPVTAAPAAKTDVRPPAPPQP